MDARSTAAISLLASMVALVAAPAIAPAATYAPANGHAYHGVSDTGAVADFDRFSNQVGAHPAVLQDFFHWRVPLTTGALYRWGATDTRGVLSLSTATGEGEELITPRQIARGKDDRYVLRLARTIAETGQTVYIRLMAEMNGHWNAYSAYNSDGSARRHGHGTRWYRLAWRRFTLLVRGGSRATINRRLRGMDLPRILRAKSENDPVYDGGPAGIPLPVPPQTAPPAGRDDVGSAELRLAEHQRQPAGRLLARRPATSTGSGSTSTRSSRVRSTRARQFFDRWDKWPFVIGEYGPWDNDQSGAFTGSLFRWAEAHDRVKMLIYYRGVDPQNSYNIQYYPGAEKALRNHLAKPRWSPYAPGVRDLVDPPPPETTSPPQRGPSLGQAAVDLRVRPTAEVADLHVGVALGLKQNRDPLVRLQRGEGGSCPIETLAALGALGGVGTVVRDRVETVDRGPGIGGGETAQEPLAGAPHRDRLVLGDDRHPGDQPARVDRRALGEQDQRRPLQRVVGVLAAERVSAGDPTQRRGVAFEQLERYAGPVGVDSAAVDDGRAASSFGGCSFHARVNPGRRSGAPRDAILGPR